MDARAKSSIRTKGCCSSGVKNFPSKRLPLPRRRSLLGGFFGESPRHGRGRIPDHLARVEVVHDLTEAEKESLGGEENLVEIGEERSEQVDWKPSSLFVTVHVRKKYARREQLPESGLSLAEQNVLVAKKPPEAIPGCLAGPGLLAQVIMSKYGDHLPLYRLEGIFERQGLKLSRQTLDGWVLHIAKFLRRYTS